MIPSTAPALTTGLASIPDGGHVPCQSRGQDPVQEGECRVVGLSDSCWTEGGLDKFGSAINFHREFAQYEPPRPLLVSDGQLAGMEKRPLDLKREVTE